MSGSGIYVEHKRVGMMLETSIPHVKKNQNQNLVINPVSFEALHEKKKEKKFAFSHTIIINFYY